MKIKIKFENRFGTKFTLTKCRDKGCMLKDISKDRYFIVNGDEIKKSSEKSVDCIIIDLRKIKENKHKVILCELTKSSKELKDAVEKFQSSGKLIINHLKEIDENVSDINCLLLGKVVKNGKIIDKKQLMKKFNIEGYDKSLIIQNEKCNYSIKELE